VVFVLSGGFGASAIQASTGALLWSSTYNPPGSLSSGAHALAVSPDGSKVFVTGSAFFNLNPSCSDYSTVGFDASTGNRLWASLYVGVANGCDYATAIGVSQDGSKVFVTGNSTGLTSRVDYATVAYAATAGTQLWVARYNGPNNANDEVWALAVSPDGSKVFVTGQSTGPKGQSWHYATVAYKASTGVQVWVRRYINKPSGLAIGTAIRVGADGSKVFVTGDGGSTIAYSAVTGQQLWIANHTGNGLTLGLSPDDLEVFVGGSINSSQYAILAYDALTGAKLWERTYNGPYPTQARALAVSPDGSKVFVTGSGGSATGSGYLTVAYAST
jgi:DNA-binding beta-propeller fold protein YncE